MTLALRRVRLVRMRTVRAPGGAGQLLTLRKRILVTELVD